MSRSHPGKSENYNKKIKRREERERDREVLRMAKEKFYRQYGEEAALDRAIIRRYKKEIYRKLAKI